MTVEEIDIIVNASVEKAVKEFEKLVPTIQKTVNQVTEKINSTDFASLKTKMQQAIQFVKTKVANLIKSNKNNELAIKVNNKEASKQISQIEKQIDSLQKKITGRQLKLDVLTNQIEQRKSDIKSEYTPDGVSQNDPRMQPFLNQKIGSDKELQKMIQQTQKLKEEINNDTRAIQQLKAETQNVKMPKTNLFSGLISQIKQATTHTKGLKQSFNQIPSITQKVTNNIKGMGTHLKGGLGHIFKYAGALLSIRGIYGILRNAASSWLSSQNAGAQQLSANIDYMKYAMGSALAPVIQFVTNLVYQLMRAIQSVAYALTGVNIFANASASSMKNMASSAKKAKDETRQLAGVHSEINNIQENKNSNSGSGGATPSFDLSKMENTPNSIIDAIKNGKWYEVGALIGKKLNEAMDSIPWDKIQSTAKKIGQGTADLLNGAIATTDWSKVGNTFAQGINTVIYLGQSFLNTFDFGNFGRAIGTSLTSAIGNIDWGALANTISAGIKGIFNTITGFFETFDWSTVLEGLWNFITNFDWNGISDAIFKALGSALGSLANLGMVIVGYIKNGFKGIEKYFQKEIEECGGNVVLGILKGIGDAVIGIGQWVYEHIFKPFIDGFKNVFGIHSPSTVMAEQGHFIIEGLFNGIQSLVGKIVDIWNNIKQTAVNIFNGIRDSIVNIWNNVVSTTTNVWNTIKNKVREGAQGAWNGITSIFGNVSGWFYDKFSQAWQAVKNVFSTGGAIFDGIKDGILNGLKAIVNAIISGINRVIAVPFNGLNSALRSIRNVNILGLRPFNWIKTIGVPQIPRLAKGNVAYEPLIAQFGEYAGASSNPEITTPQNIMRETFEDVMSDFTANDNNDRPIYLTIQVGNKKLGQILLDDLKDIKRRTGKDFEVLVGG